MKFDNIAGLSLALGLAVQFAVTVLLAALIGWWCDKLFSIAPFGMLVWIIIGFIAALYGVYKRLT